MDRNFRELEREACLDPEAKNLRQCRIQNYLRSGKKTDHPGFEVGDVVVLTERAEGRKAGKKCKSTKKYARIKYFKTSKKVYPKRRMMIYYIDKEGFVSLLPMEGAKYAWSRQTGHNVWNRSEPQPKCLAKENPECLQFYPDQRHVFAGPNADFLENYAHRKFREIYKRTLVRKNPMDDKALPYYFGIYFKEYKSNEELRELPSPDESALNAQNICEDGRCTIPTFDKNIVIDIVQPNDELINIQSIIQTWDFGEFSFLWREKRKGEIIKFRKKRTSIKDIQDEVETRLLEDKVKDETVWDRTFLTKGRIGDDYYKGYKIIGRDMNVLDGVSLGGGAREAIWVDSESYYLNKMADYAIDLFDNARKTHKDMSSIKLILGAIYATVDGSFGGYKGFETKKLAEQFYGDQIVSLDEFIKNKSGVCRHMALAAAAMIELIKEKNDLLGKCSAERNTKPGKGSHMWVRFTDLKERVWIIDPAQGYVGLLNEAGQDRWSYARPEDK